MTTDKKGVFFLFCFAVVVVVFLSVQPRVSVRKQPICENVSTLLCLIVEPMKYDKLLHDSDSCRDD